MGTRGLVSIVKDKKFAISVYSSSDSYFSSLGEHLKTFIDPNLLINSNRIKFKNKLKNIKYVKSLKNNDSYDAYDIFTKIFLGKVTEVVDESEFRKDSLFCEWHYLFDLDENLAKIYKSGNKCFQGSFKEYLKLNQKYFEDEY